MRSTAKYTGWILAIRTYVIDRMILRLVGEGADLVLNLGAGLDTRPYRLKLPASLRWVEVDYAHLIEHKEKVLSNETPKCRLDRVKLDLADRSKRRDFLMEVAASAKNALVLTEGVILYLDERQVAELAEDLLSARSVRHWIAEYMAKETYPYLKNRSRQKSMRNSPFRFFPEDWLGFFRNRGWRAREIEYLGETSHGLGRPMPAPWWAFLLRVFFSQKRVEAYRRVMGFVIFERA